MTLINYTASEIYFVSSCSKSYVLLQALPSQHVSMLIVKLNTNIVIAKCNSNL